MQPDEVRILKSYLMHDYAEKAGLPADKWHFHVLKHSIATHLLDASDDIRFVQDWLGDSNNHLINPIVGSPDLLRVRALGSTFISSSVTWLSSRSPTSLADPSIINPCKWATASNKMSAL